MTYEARHTYIYYAFFTKLLYIKVVIQKQSGNLGVLLVEKEIKRKLWIDTIAKCLYGKHFKTVYHSNCDHCFMTKPKFTYHLNWYILQKFLRVFLRITWWRGHGSSHPVGKKIFKVNNKVTGTTSLNIF